MNKKIRRRRLKKALLHGFLSLSTVFLAPLIIHGLYVNPGECQIMRTGISRETHGERKGLTVITFNIAHGRGLGFSNFSIKSYDEMSQRLHAIADYFKASDADIVCLNEVDIDSSWSFRLNQAEFLAKQAGFPYVAWGVNRDFLMPGAKMKSANAVLSRFPIESVTNADFGCYYKTWYKFVGDKRHMQITVNVDGQKVRVIPVHLDPLLAKSRQAQAEEVLASIGADDIPTIILGDFNATSRGASCWSGKNSSDDTLERFTRAGFSGRFNGADAPEQFTFPSDKPYQTIDYILTSKDFEFARYETGDLRLSDHRPVTAQLEWRKKETVTASFLNALEMRKERQQKKQWKEPSLSDIILSAKGE